LRRVVLLRTRLRKINEVGQHGKRERTPDCAEDSSSSRNRGKKSELEGKKIQGKEEEQGGSEETFLQSIDHENRRVARSYPKDRFLCNWGKLVSEGRRKKKNWLKANENTTV